jgi:hypothetical protein
MPTDVYMTINELNILFQDMVLDMLGYVKAGSPADYSNAAYAVVRVSWPTEGAPGFGIEDDVAFIRVSELDHPINRQRDVIVADYDSDYLNEETAFTRVMALNLVFYGPNSYDHAQMVRDGIYSDRYRMGLASNAIYPIPDIAAPRRAPEAFQGRWWERVDMEITFNEGISKNQYVGFIKEAVIGVHEEDGTVSDAGVDITINP